MRGVRPLVAACLFFLAADLIRPLPSEAGRHPDVGTVLVGSLGGFRALGADLLWVRAERLRRVRRHGELVTLYAMIARMVPRVPAVWYIHGYTLAYDVPFREESPERIWGWVRQGYIRLSLGLEVNPGDGLLLYARGFLAYHRIGGNEDLAAHFRKDPGLDPDGHGPLVAAGRDLGAALADPDHTSNTDICYLQVLQRIRITAEAGQAEALREEQIRMTEHIEEAHPHARQAAQTWRRRLDGR